MFGLSKIQLGLLIGAALLIASLTAYAKYATEKLGEEKARNQSLVVAVQQQGEAISTLKAERERVDALLTQVQTENAELRQRKARVKTVFREVLVNDPEAAECGNADLPASVAGLVREYADHGDGSGISKTAVEPVSERP